MRKESCCFTGHRQIPQGKQEEIANRLERVIAALYQKGVRYYGARSAQGFDALAARTVIRLRENSPGMKLILVLLCLTQTRGWRLEDIVEYERIKAQADKVVYTSQQYTPDRQQRRVCLLSDKGEWSTIEKLILTANRVGAGDGGTERGHHRPG